MFSPQYSHTLLRAFFGYTMLQNHNKLAFLHREETFLPLDTQSPLRGHRGIVFVTASPTRSRELCGQLKAKSVNYGLESWCISSS